MPHTRLIGFAPRDDVMMIAKIEILIDASRPCRHEG